MMFSANFAFCILHFAFCIELQHTIYHYITP